MNKLTKRQLQYIIRALENQIQDLEHLAENSTTHHSIDELIKEHKEIIKHIAKNG